MDYAKLLDVLTSFPISHAILPRAVCFACQVRQTVQNVFILTQVDMHLGQSEDAYFLYYKLVYFRNEPYSSSKYATDAVSIALNERLNQKVRVYFSLQVPSQKT